MLAGIAVLALFGAVRGATAGTSSLSVRLSTAKAGERNVALTATFRSELQCGYAGTVTLTLPDAMTVATAIPTSVVRIQGKHPVTVHVKGHAITVSEKRPAIMCDSIVDGPITVVVSAGAHLGNPKSDGTYRVRAQRGTATFSGTVAISG